MGKEGWGGGHISSRAENDQEASFTIFFYLDRRMCLLAHFKNKIVPISSFPL